MLPLHPCYYIITIIIKIINPCSLKSSLSITLLLLLLSSSSSSSSSSSLKGRCTIIEKDIVGSNYLSFALKVPATPTFPENNISQRKNCTACSCNLDSVTNLDSNSSPRGRNTIRIVLWLLEIAEIVVPMFQCFRETCY